MDERERDHRRDGSEQPDDEVAEYEDDDADVRRSLEREAGLSALGGPSFGGLFRREEPDGGFDAEHNP